jgi:broad specificity phosphatase PhoE
MGRFLLLLVLIVTGYVNLNAHQPNIRQNRMAIRDAAPAGTTTIYLVRHAEKITLDPQEKDPDLTEAGLRRAKDLKAYLKDVNIDAFFSTTYKRSQKTLLPLAQGRPIQFYDAHDFVQLRDKLLAEYKGKTVVVVGHSNTLLPLIDAFGAKKPFLEIADDQYDYIFRLKVSPQGKATVQTRKYGALSSAAARL